MRDRRVLCHTLVLSLAALGASGCASLRPPIPNGSGLVDWNYVSQVPVRSGSPAIAGSIRVRDLDSRPSGVENKTGRVLFANIPIIGLMAKPSSTITNAVMLLEGDSTGQLHSQEVEEILAEELRKSGLVAEARAGGAPGTYDVQGTINFSGILDVHYAGLGFLYVGLLPILTLPMMSQNSICAAEFDVVAQPSGRSVFSKSYVAKETIQIGLGLFNPRWREVRIYGEELLPTVIQRFITDLRALPASTWTD